MLDVIGANSVHSQIVYAEFIIMFFSVLSIISSLFNFEVNYEELTKMTLTFDTYKDVLNVSTLIFNSFATFVIMLNIYLRYKLQIRFEGFTGTLTQEDTLMSSGYIKNVLGECFLILFHPNVLFVSDYYEYKKRYNTPVIDSLTYSVNEVLLAFMVLRVFFIFKFMMTISYFKTSRAARTCRMYGESNSYVFALRCLFNKYPIRFVSIMFFSGMLFFTVAIRIFERTFDSANRYNNFDPSSNGNAFVDMETSAWCVIITMLTVGYGDFFPKTVFGRIYAVAEVITGLLVTSLVTAAFFQNLELEPSQSKVFILMQRMEKRVEFEDIQYRMVEKLMFHHYCIFKSKKVRDQLEKKSENMTPKELVTLNKQLKEWKKKRDHCEIEMKHLVRDKNKVLKNIQNINTSTYVMEVIVDELVSLINDICDHNKKINVNIEKLKCQFKRNELTVGNLKKKIQNDRKFKSLKRRSSVMIRTEK
jgi:hypothetical protein